MNNPMKTKASIQNQMSYQRRKNHKTAISKCHTLCLNRPNLKKKAYKKIQFQKFQARNVSLTNNQ